MGHRDWNTNGRWSTQDEADFLVRLGTHSAAGREGRLGTRRHLLAQWKRAAVRRSDWGEIDPEGLLEKAQGRTDGTVAQRARKKEGERDGATEQKTRAQSGRTRPLGK